jgi:hypothetical protein
VRIAPWLVAAVALALPRLAEAGRGVFIVPPLEIEVGRASIESVNGGTESATQVLLGLSWASLWPHRTPIDLSVGFVSVSPDARPVAPLKADPAPDRAIARVVEDTESTESKVGGFVALDVRAFEGPYWRMWVGARSETFRVDGTTTRGGFGRVSTELWIPTVESGGSAFIVGTFAVTAWAELGLRERGDGSLSSVVAAGLGLRLPFMFVN